MKKVCTIAAIIIFSLGLIFVLLSRALTESYKDFYVENIDNHTKSEYFSSNELDFARVNGVVIVPSIHAINHGEYAVDIIAYSETGLEQITVKRLSLRENENIFFKQEEQQRGVFEETEEGIFKERIETGIFFESDVELPGQKKLYLTAEIMVNDGTQETVKEIDHEITVIQYMTLNMR